MATFPMPTVRLEPASEWPDDPAGLRARYERDGVVLLRGALPRSIVDTARDDLAMRLAAQGVVDPTDGRPSWTGAPVTAIDADALHQGHPAFVDVAEHPALRQALAVVIGEPVHVYRSVNIRTSIPDDDRHVIPAHQDAMYIAPDRQFAAWWVPLVDVPLDAGSLAVVPGSHRDGLRPHPVSHDHWSSYMGEERPQRCIPYDTVTRPWGAADLLAGDLLVFDALTVHTALPNRSADVRLSIDGRFQPARNPLRNWQARLGVLEGTRQRRAVLELLDASGEELTADRREAVIATMLAGERPIDRSEIERALAEVDATS